MTKFKNRYNFFFFLILLLATLIIISFSPDLSQSSKREVLVVQILALKDSIPVNTIRHDYLIDTTIHVRFQNGYYKYWIGPFVDLAKAEHFIHRLTGRTKIMEAFVAKIQLDDPVSDNLINTEPGSVARFTNKQIDSVPEKSEMDNHSILKDSKSIKLKSSEILNEESIVSKVKKKRFLNYKSRHAIWVIVAYFFSLSFLTLAFVLYTRAYSQWMTYRRKMFIDQIQSVLADYLFDDENNQIPTSLFLIKKRVRRQILIDEIVRLKTDLSGEVLGLLNNLYRSLNLTRDSLLKLKKNRWDLKAKGFKELSIMEINEAIPVIEKYTTSRNSTLKAEAFLALVKLKKDDPLYFLNAKGIVLTRWDQLNLHVSIHNSGIEIPEFGRWLDSANESVLIFALKMTAIYKQFDAAPKIACLLNHSNAEVRKYAIQAIGEIELSDYSEALSQIYEKETYFNKLEIIRSIGLIGNQHEISILYNIVYNESDFVILLAGMKALFAMGKDGKELIKELVDKKSELVDIAMHVLDRRI